MTDEQWDAIAMLLDKGFKWKQPFGEASAAAYRVLLDGYDGEQIASALRMLIARGQVFGPTPGELVALIHHDPSRPTFDEMCRLVYGRGGILRARPRASSWPDAAARDRAYHQAAMDRAAQLHPLVATFVDRVTLDWLRNLALDHDDYGELNRKDLLARWEAHVEAMDGRDVAAIASGRRREGLQRFDPLAALGLRQPARLGSGGAA